MDTRLPGVQHPESPPLNARLLTRARPARAAPVLGDVFPDFQADSTSGKIQWREFISGSWTLFVVHPLAFNAVSATELGSVEALRYEFERRGVKVAACCCDALDTIETWVADVVSVNQCKGPGLHFPIIADAKRSLVYDLGLLTRSQKTAPDAPDTCRAVHIIGPDARLKLSLQYPVGTGHNYGEILRVIDSLQLAAKHGTATPANWKGGDKCLVGEWLSAAEAKDSFPKGVETAPLPSGKDTMRFTPDPR